MKKRVISAIIALIIAVPIFIKGGMLFNLFIYVLSMLGLKEFLNTKATKKELPSFIDFISYIVMTLIVVSNFERTDIVFSYNRWTIFNFLTSNYYIS